MENIEISDVLFEYFEKAGQNLIYHPGQCIYYQGDLSNQLYIIKRGRVRVYLIDKDGQEITLEIIEKGRIFGDSSFINQTSRPTTVEAISEVELYACTLESLLPYLGKSTTLTTTLFKLLIENMNNLSNHVHSLYFLDRYQKVASFLLEQTAHPNIEKGITSTCIPYTHQEIAYCIGLSRERVTKVLNEFKTQGFITIGYKKIIIINRRGLQEYLDNK